MEEAAPPKEPGESTALEEIALRHTSGVSPQDWERVQRALNSDS
jgi:hypothetical protein